MSLQAGVLQLAITESISFIDTMGYLELWDGMHVACGILAI